MSRITTQFPYGEHIALFCVNHPEKRWSTKNIDGIGARTIYYNLDYDRDMGPECSCPCKDLRPVRYPDLPDFVMDGLPAPDPKGTIALVKQLRAEGMEFVEAVNEAKRRLAEKTE